MHCLNLLLLHLRHMRNQSCPPTVTEQMWPSPWPWDLTMNTTNQSGLLPLSRRVNIQMKIISYQTRHCVRKEQDIAKLQLQLHHIHINFETTLWKQWSALTTDIDCINLSVSLSFGNLIKISSKITPCLSQKNQPPFDLACPKYPYCCLKYPLKLLE